MEYEHFRLSQLDVDGMGPKQVIEILQALIAGALYSDNDRNPDRRQRVQELLEQANDLCIKARERWRT